MYMLIFFNLPFYWPLFNLQLTYGDLAMLTPLYFLSWKEEKAFVDVTGCEERFTMLVSIKFVTFWYLVYFFINGYVLVWCGLFDERPANLLFSYMSRILFRLLQTFIKKCFFCRLLTNSWCFEGVVKTSFANGSWRWVALSTNSNFFYVSPRAGEPERVGAGCFLPLGAGAGDGAAL